MLSLQEYAAKIEELTHEGNQMVEVLTKKAQDSSLLKSQLQSIANEVENTVAEKVRELTQQRLNALTADAKNG